MKLTKLRLTLNLDLNPQGESVNTLKYGLNRVIQTAIDNGTLTGETEATVEHYSFTVTERRKKKHSVKRNPVYDSYPSGKCPSCAASIHRDVQDGDRCIFCGHVFHGTPVDYVADLQTKAKKRSVNLAQIENDVSAIAAEQQRRDEKHGLYGEHEDFVN